MVAAERLADSREGAVGQLAAQVHRDLAAKGNMLGALLGLQVGQPNMEEIRYRLLDYLDSRLQVVIADKIMQRLAREIDRDRSLVDLGQRRKPRQASFEFAHIR